MTDQMAEAFDLYAAGADRYAVPTGSRYTVHPLLGSVPIGRLTSLTGS